MIGLLIAAIGVFQYIYFGYNIFTLLALIILCGTGGMVSAITGKSRIDNRQIDSANLAAITQIERNRYFRKPE